MEEYSNLFVVLMGVGTVFFGLICLILLVWAMGYLFRGVDEPAAGAVVIPQPAAQRQIANGGELLAAISAAIAEELGANADAIRIVSIKKL